ncbi:MAG: SWIM zinc finger family protein, partial [Bacteroidota bacterium]|nr:SWIM zinc finger family protein [Bacteroidota bacterium]
MKKERIVEYVYRNSTRNSLERGRHLYLHNKVKKIEEHSNYIKASVQGTTMYSVFIYFDETKNLITSTECSCPYNYGGICKHKIATLYKYSSIIKEHRNPFLKEHFASEWFLIAAENNFSVKKINENF